MRALFALAALPLLATFAPLALFDEPTIPARPTFTSKPVPLFPEKPERRTLGTLIYLGGWELNSDDPRFGGISAMHVENDQAIALSDAGALMRFTLPGTSPPQIVIASLPDGPGSASSKFDRDSESLAIHGPHAWIGFERHNVVWRYRRKDGRRSAAAAPTAMRYWPRTMGSEAMVRLSDGRFLIFAEGPRRPDGTSPMLLFERDPALESSMPVGMHYRAPEGYRITDAAQLPDGRLLFLNRSFTLFGGFTAKLTISDLPKLTAGAVLAGREIADFAPPATVDNLEALSVTQERGRTILWIASDDNFLALQRTLLLKFALAE